MRAEDALVYLLALVTGVVLVAGLAQALEGTRRPRARRRPRERGLSPEPLAVTSRLEPGPTAVRGTAVSAEAAPDGLPEPPAEPPSPPQSPPRQLELPAVALEPEPAVAEQESLAAVPVTPWPPELVPEATPLELAAPALAAPSLPPSLPEIAVPEAAPLEPAPPAPADGLPRCLRAYEAGEYEEARAAAEPLARSRTPRRSKRAKAADSPIEQVALWSVLGLSRRVLADEAGARSAFEGAARWAGDLAGADLPVPVAAVATRLGRHLLTVSQGAPAGSESRRLILRLAATWLVLGEPGDAGDGDAAAVRERAREAFVAATAERVTEMIGRRQFAAAHRLIQEALGSTLVPESGRETFRDLLWTGLTGEVGRLIGQALHGAGRAGEADPMASLEAAGAVVAAVPAAALSAERREDLARRLWWAHVRLGTQLRESGDLEGATRPLFSAVELAGDDPERQGEARQALARVIEGLVERLGEGSLERLREGDLEAALAESRRLSDLVDQALQRGLSPEDLMGALGRRQEIMLQIAEGRPA